MKIKIKILNPSVILSFFPSLLFLLIYFRWTCFIFFRAKTNLLVISTSISNLFAFNENMLISVLKNDLAQHSASEIDVL